MEPIAPAIEKEGGEARSQAFEAGSGVKTPELVFLGLQGVTL